jgi:uncharacterized protein YndB with AHSA1/START domain
MQNRFLVAAALCLLSQDGRAELRHAAPDGALIEHRYALTVAPEQAWQALVHPERWWPEDHTWSLARAHLSLSPVAGGCFCENWPGGSAEHARVVMAVEPTMLRLRGSLGPLQEMAVTGVLTVKLAPTEGGTEAVVTYRLSGDPSHALDRFVPVVDQVIGLQFAAFARHAGTADDSR